MILRIALILALVTIVGRSLTRAQETTGTFCLQIVRAEARFVDFLRTPIGATKSIPPTTIYKKTGCRFQITVDVISDDGSFLQSDSAFLVIGRLPDGQQFKQPVRNLQMVESSSRVFTATFEVQTTEVGWADLILAPIDGREYNDLCDYPVKSNKRSLQLGCQF